MDFSSDQFCQHNEQRNQNSTHEVLSYFSIRSKKNVNPKTVRKNLKQLQVPGEAVAARKVGRPSSCTSNKINKRSERVSFQNATKKIKRQLQPKLQLASSTVSIIDELLNHVMELFEEELTLMNKVRKTKTLTVKQLEKVTKFCFPINLQIKANDYACKAVQNI